MVKIFPLEMSAQSTVSSRSLLCFDARSPEIGALAAYSQVPVVALADDSDLLSQISRHVSTGAFDRLHLLAHGQREIVVLGHTVIDADYLQRHAQELATWKVKEIVLWSCSVGADSTLVRLLERLSGARVLASDAPLGMTAQGVNWAIRNDGHVVALPFAASAAAEWPHELAALLFATSAYFVEDSTGASGAGKAALEDNSLKLLGKVNAAESATKFLFLSDPSSDPIYSGNNVRGFLYAINASNQVVGSYYGEMSRLVKSGSTVQAGTMYVYPDAANPSTGTPATTILIDFNTGGSFATGNTHRTSSDPVDSTLNKLLAAPQAPSSSADSDNAYEQGGAGNTLSDVGDGDASHPNASGNVLTNDNSGITTYSIVSNMLVISTSTGITVNQVTSQLSGATGSPAASSTSVSNGLSVAGRYGTLTIGQDGSYVYDVDDSNSAVQALRLSTNTLTETFTYTLANSKGLLDTETLSITIKGINDYPDANNDYNYAKESVEPLLANQYAVADKLGRKATGNVLSNDTDVDANSEEEFVVGFSLTGGATGSSQGAVTYTTLMDSNSASSLNASDTWYVYSLSSDGTTATPLYHADNTTRVTIRSKDGTGKNLSFTFSDSTNMRNVRKFLVSEDSSTPLTSAGTDYSGTINSSTAASSTTVNVSGLTGSIAVGMTVNGTNLTTAPTVSALNYTSGTLTSITVSSAVAVDAATLSFTATGTLGSDLQGQYGVLRLAADGSYTYTPTANNVGISQGQTVTEVFSYTMRDAAGSSNTSSRDTATLTISVQGSGSNDPVAIADSATGASAAVEAGTSAGSTASGNLLTNDLETDTATGPGSMTVKAARNVGSASETLISGATSINGQYGSVSISPNGDWTYTPNDANTTVNALNASQTLVDTFYYRAGNTLVTGTSATTLTVEIKGANDAPTAGNDSAVAVEDQFNPSGSVLLNDSDVDNSDTRSVTSAQAGSSTTFGAEDAVAVGSSSASNGLSLSGTYGTLVLGADGTYQYTVNNSNSSVQGLKPGDTPLQDQFVYEITDSAGAKATATLTVSIKGSDDAPVNTLPASLSTEQDTALAINGANLISVADVDNNLESVTVSVENGTLTVTAVGGAGEATLTGTSGTASFTINGTRAQINAALATLTYTPTTSFSGTDYLTVYSLDGADLFDVDTVAITVTGAATVSTVTAEDNANLGQSDSTVVEGGTLKYSVTMSAASGNAQEYSFALSGTSGSSDYEGIANFTFSDGVSYDSKSGNISVPAGVTSFSVLVDTTDDSTIENAETLIMTIGGVAGTGNITDNDSQSISSVTAEDNANLGKGDSTVEEGNTLKYSVSLSAASPNAETYAFALSGTASSSDYEGIANFTFSDGVTYDSKTGNITVPAGVTSFSVLVDTTDDSSVESSETLIMSIGGVAGTGTITDNDTAGLVLGTISGNTTEAGGTATFTVKLSSQPTDDVTVKVSSSDTTEGSVDKTLTFTSANWSTTQTVTVTGVDDLLIDGDIAYSAQLSATSKDTNFSGKTGTVSITNTDDDVQSISSVTAEDNANLGKGDSTVEEGNTLKYSVSLSAASPNAETYAFALSGTSGSSDYEGIANFTFSDGVTYDSKTGNITVPAGVTSFSVLVDTTDDSSVESSETLIMSIGGVTGTGTITDNDTAGLVLGTISGNTTEAGGTATFTVKLSSQPTDDVTVKVSSSDTTEGSVDKTLTFTSSNWNTTQTVTVTGVDDLVIDGDIGYSAQLSATSKDTNFSGKTGTVSITNTDDDVQSISSVTAEDSANLGKGDSTVEEGNTLKYSVSLSAASPNAETYAFALSGTSGSSDYEGIANFTFSDGVTYDSKTGNITVPAGVTSFSVLVDTTDDSSVESSETLIMSIGGVTGTGTITDNDTAGLVLGTISGNTTEAGGTATFTVKLSSQPTDDVTVKVSSSDTTEGSVDKTLTFTSSNWNTTQTVTVTGVDDLLIDGDIGYSAQLSATSKDTNFSGKTGTVSITNTDDDVQSISSVTAEDNANLGKGDSAVEEGNTLKYSVSLSAASPNAETYAFALSGTASSSDYEGIANFTFSDGVTYDSKTGNITVPAGVTSFSVLVDTTDDSSVETSETLIMSIGGVTGTGTITDNDTAGLVLGTISGNTTEAGGTATFTVKLSSQPTDDVTVKVSSSDTTEGSVDKTLTFTSANWSTTQTVTVTGVDDLLIDGDIAYSAQLSASSKDTNFSGKTGTVSITNTDDDVQSISSVTAEDNANLGKGDSTVEEGNTLKYSVSLSAASPNAETYAFALSGTASSSDYEGIANFTFSDGVTYDSKTGNITVPAGVTSFSVLVDTVDDSSVETSETLIMSIGGVTGTGTITDNDTAGLVLGTISGNTTEAGGTATFTVKLSSQPTDDVTAKVSSSDTTEGSVDTTLTFTSANWNTTQTVTVTGVDDLLIDGDIGYSAQLSATSKDTNFSGKTGTVSITNTDDDVQSISSVTAEDSANLGKGDSTVEEGNTLKYSVSLSAASPNAETYAFALSGTASSSDYEGIANFTFSDGVTYDSKTGNITVPAGVTSFSVLVDTTDDSSVESSETLIMSIGGVTGTGTITDNDTAGLVLGTISGNTTEAGGTATFTVKLSSQPTDDVTVKVSSSDTTEGSVDTTLTFTSANWNTTQTVTVTGVDDLLIDGDIAYSAQLSASSKDTNFNSKSGTVSITNTDDDVQSISSVTAEDNANLGKGDSTVEEGNTLKYSVSLSAASPNAETYAFALSGTASSSDYEGIANFTFSDGVTYDSKSGNITVPAGVTSFSVLVDTVDDSSVESSETLIMSIGGVTGTGTITDNDTAGLVLGTISGNTTEAGGTATFTVKLSSQPTDDVTVSVGSSDKSEGSVSETLTFTSANWNTTQTVTVTGVDDLLIDGDIGYSAQLSATSKDTNFNSKTGTVSITNTDDDVQSISSVTAEDNANLGKGDSTVEEGNTLKYSVSLSAASPIAETYAFALSGTASSSDYEGIANFTFSDGVTYDSKSGNITVPAGVTSFSVLVDTTDDSSVESSETLIMSIGGVTGTGTITDNDTAGLVLGTISGNTTEAGGTATFTVKLSSQPTDDVTVKVSSSDTTEGSVDKTLTFTSANWNTTQTVTVTGVDDLLIDGDIGYSAQLSATSKDTNFSGKTGTVSITNTDNDVQSISSVTAEDNANLGKSDSTVEEGNTLKYSVSLSAASPNAETYAFALSGTASASDYEGIANFTFSDGVTYDSKSGNITVPAGVTSFSVLVDTTDDSTIENTETLIMSIGGVTGTGNITDNDAQSISSVSAEDSANLGKGDSTVEEGNSLKYSVSLSAASPNAETYAFAMSGSASSSDYESIGGFTFSDGVTYDSKSGNITVPAGVTSFSVLVDTTDDSSIENAETLIVTIGGVAGTGNITDNDTQSVSSVVAEDNANQGNSDSTVEEGGTLKYTVSLNAASPRNEEHSFTLGGTAGGSDYEGIANFSFSNGVTYNSTTGKITVPAGVTSFTVLIDTVDDNMVEASETLQLTVGSKSATGTITDNDTAGLVLGTVSGNTTEAGGTATFTVKLASQPASDVTMSVSSSDTTEGTVTQTLTFTAANWNTTQTVTVTGADDLLVDGNVAYQALLSTSSSDSNYDKRSGAADITNTDNDVQTITVTAPANKVSEGSVAPFTVTLGKVATSATVVTLTLGSDTDNATANATSGTDYSTNLLVNYKRSSDNTVVTETIASGATVSLAAGETSFKVLASTSADSPRVYEGDEVFTFKAAITGASDTRSVTISDDGSGSVYKNDGTVDADASKDDDRPSIASVSVVDADNRSASPADTTVVEGGTLEFTVTLSNASLSATQFALTLGGTALDTDYDDLVFSNGVTYDSNSGTLSVPAGVTSFTVTVATVDDAVIENAETLTLDVGGVSATGTITDNDELPPAPAPRPTPTPTPPPAPTPTPELPFGADLDPKTDTSGGERITRIIEPEFTINAAGRMAAGDTAILLDPQGAPIGTAVVTPDDVTNGTVNVPTVPLDDGVYTFIAQIRDENGNVKGEAPVVVTIITDRDGIAPSTELAANGGDFNQDGTPDWEQNNVAQLPVTSLEAFQAGRNAPASSFGAIMVGDVPASDTNAPVQLNSGAQLLDLALIPEPQPLPAGFTAATPTFEFSVTSEQGRELNDIAPDVPGLQTRVVIELPQGVRANVYKKFDPKSGSWVSLMDDQSLDTFDDGATLIDRNGDGLIDRIVVTLTDGGPGDEDGIVNGVIVDPGLLAFQAPEATPVFSVLLANGDRYYSTEASEAARMAKGTGNVFEGARFDSLATADGGRQIDAHHNFITGDWYFTADGQPMPYACYVEQPDAGFQAAAQGRGPGVDFHLWLDRAGTTQLVTNTEAAQLGLAAKGYRDLGAVFNTTTNSAFQFDAEGYLVSNADNASVRQLVGALSGQYSRTSDAGFIEAVESHYLQQVDLVGLPRMSAATAADVNALYGTGFGA